MKPLPKTLLLLVLMFLAAGLGWELRPTNFLAEQGPKVNLEEFIPRQFGDWRQLPQSNTQIINPQEAANLKRVYSQTLSRTYINSQQSLIMLSVAYGVNQSRDTQLHKPEICYPAQGFDLKFTRPARLQTNFGNIDTTQVIANLGRRQEPITYWMRVGDSVIRGGLPQTLKRLNLGLFERVVADGLLFRVSDISQDPDASFQLQGNFIRALLDAASPQLRPFLIGVKPNAEQ